MDDPHSYTLPTDGFPQSPAVSGANRSSGRRSWFSGKPTKFEIAVEHQNFKDDNDENEVEYLELTHFSKQPRLDFGTIKVGKTISRTLIVHNPHDYEQQVIIEKFPTKKDFTVDLLEFSVDASDALSVTFSWSPTEAMRCREMVIFKIDDAYRLQAILFGQATEPPKPKKRNAMAMRGRKTASTNRSSQSRSSQSRAVLGECVDNVSNTTQINTRKPAEKSAVSSRISRKSLHSGSRTAVPEVTRKDHLNTFEVENKSLSKTMVLSCPLIPDDPSLNELPDTPRRRSTFVKDDPSLPETPTRRTTFQKDDPSLPHTPARRTTFQKDDPSMPITPIRRETFLKKVPALEILGNLQGAARRLSRITTEETEEDPIDDLEYILDVETTPGSLRRSLTYTKLNVSRSPNPPSRGSPTKSPTIDEEERAVRNQVPCSVPGRPSYLSRHVEGNDEADLEEPEEAANLSVASSQYFTPLTTPLETPHGSDSEEDDASYEDSVMYFPGQEPATPDPGHVTIIENSVIETTEVRIVETCTEITDEVVQAVVIEDHLPNNELHAEINILESEEHKEITEVIVSSEVHTVTTVPREYLTEEPSVTELRTSTVVKQEESECVPEDQVVLHFDDSAWRKKADDTCQAALSCRGEDKASSLDSWLEKGAHFQQDISPRMALEGSFSHQQIIDKLETVKVELGQRLSSTPLAVPLRFRPSEEDISSSPTLRRLPTSTPSPIIGRRVSNETVVKSRPSLSLFTRAMHDPRLMIDEAPEFNQKELKEKEPKRQLFGEEHRIAKDHKRMQPSDNRRAEHEAVLCGHHGDNHNALRSAIETQVGDITSPSHSHQGIPLLLKAKAISPQKRPLSGDRESTSCRLATASTESSRKKMKGETRKSKDPAAQKPVASKSFIDGDRKMTKTMQLRRQAALNSMKKSDVTQKPSKTVSKPPLNVTSKTSRPSRGTDAATAPVRTGRHGTSLSNASTKGPVGLSASSSSLSRTSLNFSSASEKPVVSRANLSCVTSKHNSSKGPTRRLAKGVAQSKLTLINHNKSTVMPKHPLPYAAKNVYYDERWMEKQERGFVLWLNFILTPHEEFKNSADKKQKVDAGKLMMDAHRETIKLAPTKEILSFRAYTARRRINRLRRSACLLYQSEDMIQVIGKLERVIELGRIRIRTDRKIYADLGLKQRVLDMLLCYNPLWLRIGLETIYGEMIPMHSNIDIITLSRFIITRLLGNPDIAHKYAHATVPHLYKNGYDEELSQFTLKKFLLFILFVDHAKRSRIIDHDPCLFCKDAEFKASRDLLLNFSRDFLAGEGDLTKHLSYFGYVVSHSQTALEEFDFAVADLASDLKCGLRLTRVVELLTQNWTLSKDLRVPAISRLQKVHNVEVAFRALQQKGAELKTTKGADIDARAIVDGHREKTLRVLWLIMFNFQVEMLINEEQLREEIAFLTKNLRYKKDISALLRDVERCATPDRRASVEPDMYLQSKRLSLLLKWCRAVCAHYGMKIDNFTVSFSDGRALCYLLHHYHPTLLALENINQDTTLTFKGEGQGQEVGSDSDDDSFVGHWTQTFHNGCDKPKIFSELLANEKENFKLIHDKLLEIGGIPFMVKSADMSNTIPDEKIVITFVTYLCARLLDLRQEVRAARVIQVAWRQHHLRQQHKLRQVQVTAAILIQRCFREYLSRKTRESRDCAAVLIQAHWRRLLAKRRINRLRRSAVEIQEHQAACCIQVCARKFLTKLHVRKRIQAATVLQAAWRGRAAREQQRSLNQAAVSIQQHYRAAKEAQRQRQLFLLKKRSAAVIQVAVRGMLARRRLLQLRAAIKIQGAYKMYVTRRKYLEMKEKATLISAWYRMTTQRQRFIQAKTAVIVLQRHFRALQLSRTQRSCFLHMKSAAILIQRSYRQKVEARRGKQLEAATKIQAWYRGRKQQSHFDDFRMTVVKVQQHFRAVRAARQQQLVYHVMRGASITIQAWVRRYLAQCRVRSMHKAATVIQASFRRFASEKRYRGQQQACLVIQRWFRLSMHARVDQSVFLIRRHQVAKIQATFRAYQVRKQFLTQKKAAKVIQSCCRMHICRQRYLQMRHAALTIQCRYRYLKIGRATGAYRELTDQAAVTIQSVFRGYLARKKVQMIRSAIMVQSCWRAYRQKKSYLKTLKHVTVIQSCIRMYQQRKKYEMQKSAAVLLQRKWRATLMARRQHKWYTIMVRATVTLQSCLRGWKQRQIYSRLRGAAIVLQSATRGLLARKRLGQRQEAARTIQVFYRSCCVARGVQHEYQNQKKAALVLQSHFRRTRAQHLLKEHKAAKVIQSAYRMHVAKVMFQAERAHIIKIQAAIKGHICRKAYAKKKQAITTIQNRWRAEILKRKVQRQFHITLGAVITLQATFKGYIQRKRYHMYRRGITRLQATLKARKQQRHYAQLKLATVTLQQRFRALQQGKAIRLSYHEKRGAIITLQSAVRGLHARNYVRKVKAAVIIQKHYRMTLARSLFLKQKTAAVVIQSHARRIMCRKSFLEKMSAVVCIQRRWRATLHMKKEIRRYHLMVGAAITIQCSYKGYQERKQYTGMKTGFTLLQAAFRSRKQRMNFLQLKKAACTIQLRYRAVRKGLEVRHQYAVQRKSVVTLQSLVRGVIARRRVKRITATITLQRQWKMVQARKTFIRQKSSVTLLQSHIRKILQRQQFLRVKSAAIIIQKRLRAKLLSNKLQQDYKMVIGAAIKIQTAVRCHLQRKNFLKQKLGFTKLQAEIRRKLQQQNYQKMKRAARTVQLRYRATQLANRTRNDFLKYKSAAIVVQSLARGLIARHRVQRIRAAIVLQKQWRMIIQRQDFLRKRAAVITLQSHLRRISVRKDFLKQKNAVTLIQTRWRSTLLSRRVRRDFNIMVGSTITIQATFKSYLQKKRFLTQKTGFSKLQALIRQKQQQQKYLKLQKATSTIQAHFRARLTTKTVQKQYVVLRNATIVIQSALRGANARKHVRAIQAAVTLQKQWRMVKDRKLFLRRKAAAVTIQSHFKRISTRKVFLRQKSAATLIQTRWCATLLARKLRHDFNIVIRAAITIQAAFKCYLQRKRFLTQKIGFTKLQATIRQKQQQQKYLKLQKATSTIQAHFRAHLTTKTVQKQYAALRNATIVIQSALRGANTRKHVRAVRAAVTLQKQWRMVKDRREFLKKTTAAVLLQSHFRRMSARKVFLQQKNAVIVLQGRWRSTLAARRLRHDFNIMIGAAITIQAAFKSHQQRKRFLTQKTGFTKLQATVRQKQQQRSYMRLQKSTSLIQAQFRAHLTAKTVQKQYAVLRNATIVIQSALRGALARKHVRAIRAAVTLQKQWRMVRTRRMYKCTRRSVVVLQSLFRSNKAVIKYKTQKHATLFIQRRWRACLLARRAVAEYNNVRAATITVQAGYRGLRQRRDYLAMREGFVLLQSLVKSKQQKSKYEELRAATLVCQRRYRAILIGRKVCNRYVMMIKASLCIQTTFRKYVTHKRYQVAKRGFIKLQAAVRGKLARSRYRRLKLATQVLQKNMREYQKRRSLQLEYERTCAASVVLQTYVRGMLARRHLRSIRAAVLIQKHWRMVQQRQRFLKIRNAACVLQRQYRMKKTMEKFNELKKATLCLQKHLRSALLGRKVRIEFTRKRKAACTIQKWWLTEQARRHREQELAATRIQAVFRMSTARKTFKHSIRRVVIVQSLVRGWLERRRHLVRVAERRAAVVIQQTFRKHLACRRAQEQRQKRQIYIERYTSVVHRHLCVIRIQRRWQHHRILLKAKHQMGAIITLQRWFRSRLQRLHFTHLLKNVRVLQGAAKNYLHRRHKAAAVLQQSVRVWLIKRRQVRKVRAVTSIQAMWRGYKVRKQVKDKKVKNVRKRIEEAARNATEEKKLCNRTRSALDYLLQCKQLALVLEAVMNLDVATRLSAHCCEWLVHENAQNVLYRLVRGCNRSLPHMEIIKHTINIFLNLAKYQKTRAAVYGVPDSMDTLVELMAIYRDKGTIFTKTCTLMGLLCNDPVRRREVLSMQKIIDKLQSIHTLTSRKHKMEERRQMAKSKMAASKSYGGAVPKLTPTKHLRLRPAWFAKRDSLHQIEDPLQAINFVFANLRLATK